jgi:hypothetical protein
MTHRRNIWLWSSFILLLIGGTIYVLLRSRQTLLNVLIDATGANGVNGLREKVATLTIPEWVVYSLPGGLWSAAYILLIHALTMGERPVRRLLWAALIPAVGVLSELMQQHHLLPGVADRWDVFFYALPYFIYFVYISLKTIRS